MARTSVGFFKLVMAASLTLTQMGGPTAGARQEQSGSLTFKLAYCGQGAGRSSIRSSNAYNVSDGTQVRGSYTSYYKEREARREFERLRASLQGVERAEFGEGVDGENVQAVWGRVDVDGAEAVVLLTLEGAFLSRVEAASKAHILAFRAAARAAAARAEASGRL